MCYSYARKIWKSVTRYGRKGAKTSLNNLCNVPSLAVYCHYFHCFCSSKFANCIPLPSPMTLLYRTFFLLISLFCPMLLLQELTSFFPLSFLLLLNYGAFLDSVLPLPFDSSSFNLFSTRILILRPCVFRTIYEEASPVSWFALPSICAFYFTKLSKVSVYSFMILYVHHFIPHIFIYST